MSKVTMDLRGLNCPIPVLKLNVAVAKKEVKPGDTVEVLADCPTFEDDLRQWCTKSKHLLVKCFVDGTHKVGVVQI